MATPNPRTNILLGRGTKANLTASLADILEGEIVFATDENLTYVKSGGSLVASSVSSVNSQSGVVVLDADDIDDTSTTNKFATAAQLAAADSATQPGDNVSTLTNDANYIDAAGAPVQSVAGKTGAVSLVKGDVGLGNVDNTSDANKPISTATQSALNLKADLVGGVVPNSQLPSLAITEYLGTVANQAALLALSGQRGDWAIRTDTGSTWVLTTDGGSTITDWTELATPADAVTSVNGFTGTVVLGAGDVGAATASQGALADTAVQRAGDTMTGALGMPVGSAVSPSVYFDANTGLYSPGADQVAISTDGSEKLRIGSAGQIGLSGANYGTAGQVLTSNGSSSAPTWQDASGGGGGGTADFVASGTIANGDTVVVNSDGTVSTISGSGSITSDLGTSVVFESANTVTIVATFDSNSNKVVIVYRDGGNSNYGTAIIGTVSGTSISFGTPVVFNSASTIYSAVVFDPSTNNVVISYKDSGNSDYGTAIVGTVSGTSISFGTPVVFNSATTNYTWATFDSNSNKVVIAYSDNGNSNYGTAVVGTVSGTSISFGTPTVFDATTAQYIEATFDSSNNKAVIVYRDLSNSSYAKAVVGTVSGTSISFGTPVVFNSASTLQFSSVFDPSTNKVVVTYRDLGDSNYGKVIVGTVSGTSISFGTPVGFANTAINESRVEYNSSTSRVVILWSETSGRVIIEGKVEGNSVTLSSSSTLVSDTSSGFIGAAFDSSNDKIVFAWNDDSNLDYGTAAVYAPTTFTSNLTSGNYVGIAAEAISDTATGTINIVGGINEGQSGLTAGNKYYVDPTGGLSLDPYLPEGVVVPGVPTVTAGTAISATKLIVKG